MLGLSKQGFGDALSILGLGLAQAGSGNQNWGANALLGLQNMRQQRMQNQLALEDRQRQNQLFEFQKQKYEADLKAAADEKARQAQIRGMLPPDQQRLFDLDPGTFAQKYIGQAFPDPMKAPTVKDFYEGDKVVQKQWNDRTGQWETVGQGNRWKDEGAGIQVDTNGDGIPDIVVGGKGMKPPTEFQGKSANQYTLLESGLDGLERLAGQASPGRMAVADQMAQFGPLGALAGQSLVLNPKDKQYQNSLAKALESLATSITGAAFTKEQEARFKQMMPLPTDDPETVNSKVREMRAYIGQLRRNAGPAAPAAGATLTYNPATGEFE